MVWGAIGKRKRTLAIEPEKEPQFNETETTILLPGKNELRLGPLGLRAQPQKTLLENLLTVQTLSGTGYGEPRPSALLNPNSLPLIEPSPRTPAWNEVLATLRSLAKVGGENARHAKLQVAKVRRGDTPPPIEVGHPECPK